MEALTIIGAIAAIAIVVVISFVWFILKPNDKIDELERPSASRVRPSDTIDEDDDEEDDEERRERKEERREREAEDYANPLADPNAWNLDDANGLGAELQYVGVDPEDRDPEDR